jgi:hypothetical protein
VRLYGKQADLVRAQPGCGITLTADIQPLPRPILIGGYDPRRAQLFDSRAFKTRRHRQFAIKEGALTAQYMRRERLWERD